VELVNEKLVITEQERSALAEAMNSKYRLARGERQFEVEVTRKGKGVYVMVLLANADQSFYYPVEARIIWENQDLTAHKAALFLVDYIDIYFEEFLLEEDEQMYVPIDWADHQYDAIDFQIRGQIRNRKLENQADEWLGESEPAEPS